MPESRNAPHAGGSSEERSLAFAWEVVEAITTSPKRNGALQACAEAILKHLEARIARVWVYRDKAGRVRNRASLRLLASAGPVDRRLPARSEIADLERVIEDRQPRLLHTLETDPGPIGRATVEKYGLAAFAGYPLCCREALGALEVYFDHPPSELVLRSLESAAGNIALAIGRRGTERAGPELEESRRVLEAKNAELAAASQRFQQVIESAPNGILLVESDGAIALANRQVEKMFGYAREELIGQTVEILLPARASSPDPAQRAAFFSDPRARAVGSALELFAVRKDGIEFPVEVDLNPISSGGSSTLLCSIVDISERKRGEARLLEASRLKSEFLANMSHEIRTPLNVLVGMSGLLMETALNPEQRDYAETIHRGAGTLLAVINDSLDLSKIEAGKLVIDPADFDPGELVEDVGEFLAQQSSSKGLELTCAVGREVPRQIRGDAARVRQVLINLVANAIKFTEEGEINLRLSLLGTADCRTTLRFEVHDTGVGIPQHVQGRLFEPFTQADGSTTRKYGGTGLGLAISKRLVELMQGSIGLASEAGKGTTFWMELPFEPAREPVEAESPPEALAGLRVLVVDDNASQLAIMQADLESWNVRACLAGNAPQAMQMMRDAIRAGEPYGAAIIDYGLPGMTGLDLARVIRMDRKVTQTPVILLATYRERHEAEAAKQIGGLTCLGKPPRKRHLRQALERALRPEESHADPSPAPAAASPGRRPGKVLLVEDNLDNQKLAIRLLEKGGYDCDVAANGAEALERLSRAQYPLILMDCQMPVMDGFQATAAIREREIAGRHTPVVAMTAHSLQGYREKCLEAGMDDYLSKPVNEKLLLKTIERWIAPGAATPAALPPSSLAAPSAGASEPEPPGRRSPLSVAAKPGMEDLIPEYLLNRQRDLQSLGSAVSSGRLDEARVIGHGMKGSGTGYGFPDLTRIGRAIEKAAAAADTAALREQIAALGDYLSRVEVVY